MHSIETCLRNMLMNWIRIDFLVIMILGRVIQKKNKNNRELPNLIKSVNISYALFF